MRSALFTTSCVAVALCAACVTAPIAAQTAWNDSANLDMATARLAEPVPGTMVATASAPDVFTGSLDGVSSSSVGLAETSADLPDAPVAADVDTGMQAGVAHAPSPQPIAPKYSPTILPGQGAVPLSSGGKVAFAFRQEVSPFTMFSRVLSATWSQAIDSQPHYGQGWEPYGQRVGAAFARGAVQDLATMAVFDPIFRDDPRYYILGRQHKLLNRAIYAATRVIVTRTDSGHNTVNAPLLLGYAAAAGANFAYYPERDRNFSDAAAGYAGSLGGSVLGFEVSEFLPDILRIAHLRHD